MPFEKAASSQCRKIAPLHARLDKLPYFAWLLPLTLVVAQPVLASTILDTGVSATGPSVQQTQYVEQGWSQTQTYTNVSISVALFSWTPGNTFNITAYLTTATGPSATTALATDVFSGQTADATPQNFLLFSGLTLGPGSYYVTLAGSDNIGAQPGALWPTECDSGCPITEDTGIVLLDQNFANGSFGSQNPSFPPGSTFVTGPSPVNLLITADSNSGVPTPEPSAIAQMLAAFTALLLARRKFHGQMRRA
jgi:hypothetical protein